MNFRNMMYIFVFILSLVFLVGAQLFGSFNSLEAYCVSAGFETVSNDCALKFLQGQDFSQLEPEVFENSLITDTIFSNQEMLDKYSKQILKKDITLKREVEFFSGVKFDKDGILTLPKPRSYSDISSFNLKNIPETSEVSIFKDSITIELPENLKVESLEGISQNENSLTNLKASKFYLKEHLVEIQGGDVFIDPNRGIMLPKGIKAGYFDGKQMIYIENLGIEPLNFNIEKKDVFQFNDISFYNDGKKNILARFSENGKYSIDFGKEHTEVIGGSGQKGKILFRDITLDDVNQIVDDKISDYPRKTIKEFFGDYSVVESNLDNIFLFKDSNGAYQRELIGENKKPILVGSMKGESIMYQNNGDVVGFNIGDKIVSVKGTSLKKISIPDTEKIENIESSIKNLADEFNWHPRESTKEYIGDIPDNVQVYSQNGNMIESGEAYMSVYRPGEKGGLGGKDITSSGLPVLKAVENNIPVVAGSERLGTGVGKAIYLLENPANGKKTLVAVLDSFGRKTLNNYPGRFFDAIPDTGVLKELGITSKGDPSNPASYGVYKIRFKLVKLLGL